MTTVVTCFGEIMARIQPEGFHRIRQGFPGRADISFAGAEANVAVSLQMIGRDSRYVTALPVGALGDAALDSVRRFGVDTCFVLRTKGRLGLYFVERGANQRPSDVIYIRLRAQTGISTGFVYSGNWVDACATKSAAPFGLNHTAPRSTPSSLPRAYRKRTRARLLPR